MKTLNRTVTAACSALAAFGLAFAAIADETVAESVTWTESKTISDTLTVTGSGTTLTLAAGKAITVTPGAGKLVVTNGASVKAPSNGSDDSFVVAAEADGAAVESGVADVLDVSGGSTVCLDFLNNAAATGRIEVAGGLVKFDRFTGWKYNNPTFEGNPWIIDVAEDATACFGHGNQGGHFNASGTATLVTGAGSVRLSQQYNTDNGPFAINAGAVFANTGALELFGQYARYGGVFAFKSGSKVAGPATVTLGDKHDGRVVLQVNAGADFTVRDVDFVRARSTDQVGDDELCGDGVIKIDAGEADVTVAANVPATLWSDATKANAIAFEKSGAHDALLAVTNIPTLVVAEGTATLTNDCTIGELTVADGATLVVDGATLRYASSAGSVGTIELRNGAAKVRVISGTAESGTADASLAMDRSGLASDATLEKTGETDLIVYDPSSVAGLVHVAGGALRFSKRGLSDKFFRLTVKECYPWGTSTYKGLFLRAGLYDANGTLIDLGWGGTVASYGTSADQLAEKGWAMPEGTLFTGNIYDGKCIASLTGVFMCGKFPNAYYTPWFTNATQTLCKDASDESGWQKIWGRLALSWAAIDGINFYSGWSWGIVKTWTVETSQTGADGTWQVVQDIVDMPQELENNGYGVLNGDATGATPAAHFRYVEPGVTGLADTLQIRVDAGATLDFGAKTGGQAIDRVLIDATAESSGTVTNVVFAETGVIELVGGSVRSAKGLLPLVFEGASGTANLANWTVTCDGKTCNRRVSFAAAEKKIELTPFGTVMVVR